MTNGPIEQPMSNAEIRQLLGQIAAQQQANTTAIADFTTEARAWTASNARTIQAIEDERIERRELEELRRAEHLDRMDNAERQLRILSEFAQTAFAREQERYGDSREEPSLREMLQQALDRLDQIWRRLSA